MITREIKLKTIVDLPDYNFKVNHNSKILTIGSCFSDHLGDFLTENKFKVWANPLGNVYNIQSVFDLILTALNEKELKNDWFVQRDDVFLHYSYHSEVFGSTIQQLKATINDINKKVAQWLSEIDLLVITLGTSWVYSKNNQIVSNCHRQPSNEFDKLLFMPDEQIKTLSTLLIKLKIINPEIKVILTVSPVRHIKDGLQGNSVSKSILRWVCENIIHQIPDTYYFPSYEIMTDELRDYRFYGSDLIHPNELAKEYIIQKFAQTVFDKRSIQIIEKWDTILKAINHRPLTTKGSTYKSFLENTKQKLIPFGEHFDITSELNEINSRLERT